MEFHTFTLQNGIRVIFKPTKSAVSHCAVIVNAGSRDELVNEHGLAHYIEHCIFKGTEKRKTYHILTRLDSVGGELNAYTTKEETCIYASFLKMHLLRAVDLVSDICFHSIFPEKEIAKEKDVIVDEIHSYLDTPSEIIFDEYEEKLFANHPLGQSILGTEESVRSFDRNAINQFRKRNYTSDELVLSIVGNHTLGQIKRIAERCLGQVKLGSTERKRQKFEKAARFHEEKTSDLVSQVHYILGSEAHSYHSKDKLTMVLLNNYLGGPAMNSRLNLGIREKYGIAYNIESSYTPYNDTGLFEVYLGTDQRSFKRAKSLVMKELKAVRERKLGTSTFHLAKEQLKGQIALSQESGVGTMISLGKSLLHFNKVDTLPILFDEIDAIEAIDLQRVAQDVLKEDGLSSMAYVPAQ